jgi:hypothetical protein
MRQRFDQSYHPFTKFLPGKHLKDVTCSFFPKMSIHTDLGWIVKIPDLENVIMDA